MIDWYRVMVDLHQAGLTTNRIAGCIAVPVTRARGWRQYGHVPRHDDGEALLVLWCHVTQKRQETAPRTAEHRRVILPKILKERGDGHGQRKGQG